MDLSKGVPVEIRTASGAKVTSLSAELSWEETQKKGFGRFKQALGLGDTDIDVVAIIYQGRDAVDWVGPGHLSALSGKVVHSGDVKKGTGEGAGEKITIDLAGIEERDSDISGIVLAATCKTGSFANIASAVCRLTSGDEFLGNVRFPVVGEHLGALLAAVQKDANGAWTFQKLSNRGQARNWQELARLVPGELF